jgi:hypothetical protein
MGDKKETAVEWFVEKLKAGIDPEDGSISMNWLHDGTIEQAKEMEKQQIIDAYHINPLETKWGSIGLDYYLETYRGQNND